MSLTPGFAPDAASRWRELETPIQELVLDELDRLVLHPLTSGRHRLSVASDDRSVCHYLVMQIDVNETRGTATVFDLRYEKRRASRWNGA